MTPAPPTVATDTPIGLAATDIVRNESRLFVAKQGRPVGVPSTTDFFHVVRALRIEHPISRYMSGALISIDAAEPLASEAFPDHVEVEAAMSARAITLPATMPIFQAAELRPQVVVAMTDQPVGVLTGLDFARACSELHRTST